MAPGDEARGMNRRSVNSDWTRALQATATIDKEPRRTLPLAFDAIAQQRGDAPALLSKREAYSFRELSQRAQDCARWAQAQGLRKGDAVALMMENRPDYVAIWLGLTRIGVVVALINVNLVGEALAHCLRIANPRLVITTPELAARCAGAPGVDAGLTIHDADFARARDALEAPLDVEEVTLADPALYIYTSGTTGLPKAAIVTHRRLMNWSLWFRGLANMTSDDRMYDCLPLYHSVGGVAAIFAPLLAGGSVFIRERFSARAFWPEVVAQGCTLFQYIGELCRYLAFAPPCPEESRHRLRLAIGNGLRPEIWTRFSERFAIPRILEFYAATESNFSLYNVEGEPGSIGRSPAFLAAHQRLRIVRYDETADAPLRGADGFCEICGADEPGEAIAAVSAKAGESFDGYLDRDATENKILRDVFAPGDAWMRSGDLMRKDARGFFYFVDRVGDSFRWKGENVASAEVAAALAAYPGVVDAAVYGVEVAGRDGRAGMAALVVAEGFDLAGLRAFLVARLPAYARPLFLRLSGSLAVTETFKHRKRELATQGFDPRVVGEPLFFAAPDCPVYAALDLALYKRILSGDVSL